MADERMEVEEVLAGLNRALACSLRSLVELTLAAGGTTGATHQFVARELAGFAEAELRDARRLVEKITALGGEAKPEAAPARGPGDDAFAAVVESERKALDALAAVIPHTGTDAESEALEHLLEHLILRKQSQLDFLARVAAG